MKNQREVLSQSVREKGEKQFLLKITFAGTLLIVSLLCLNYSSFPYSLIFQLLLGALYVHMKELQHEALHSPTRWNKFNRFTGVILGFPLLISYSEYQYYHLKHHKFIGTPKDTEYFNNDINENKPKSLIWSIVASYFMLDHYINILKKMLLMVLFNKSVIYEKATRHKIKTEYILFFCIIFASILGSILNTEFGLILIKNWLIPAIFVAIPINFLIELPEHYRCDRSDKNIFSNTRTIKSNFLAAWFVNGNNYHVEHHYMPHFPISELPRIHAKIKSDIKYFNPTYFSFYKSLFFCQSKVVA